MPADKRMHPPKSPAQSGFIVVGGEVDRVHVSVGFNGPTLEPSALSIALRCRPSEAHARGQTRLIRGVAHPWSSGNWLVDAGPWKKEDVGRAIDRALRKIKADTATVRKIAARFKGRVFCGIATERWNRGFEVPTSTLARIASRGLSLSVDIYAYKPERVDWSPTRRPGSRRKNPKGPGKAVRNA